MKKARTRIIWGIVIVIIAVIVIARVFRKQEPVVPTPDPVVTVQTPQMGDILLTTDLVGTIEPADIVYIYPKAGGDVTAVNVKAGDVVAAGQVLLEIDTKQVDTSKTPWTRQRWRGMTHSLPCPVWPRSMRQALYLIKSLRDIRLLLRLIGFSMSPPRLHMKTRWNSAM